MEVDDGILGERRSTKILFIWLAFYLVEIPWVLFLGWLAITHVG